ncbi:MAG: PIN domain-containing protein [Erysipelotrichaceae bacterium]|nr:PIN domain-containing protein [Erysipelotrichaceae bacterium]
MILLIDAIVLLDVIMKRQEFVKDSSVIWKLCETGKVKGYVSSLTIASIVDIMQKEMDPQKIEEVLSMLSMIFEFTDLCVSDIQQAARMQWNDYEDAIQSATAQRIHADFIITRNIKDFAKSKILTFTPVELLARI